MFHPKKFKICIFGGTAVGKTSLVQQFATNIFTEEYTTTTMPCLTEKTVMYNGEVYQLKILDLPPTTTFPVNSMEEWDNWSSIVTSDIRHFGSLRSASAYLLVYDASNLDSFQHVKALKEQIYESRDMHNVPVLIVANKYDLITPSSSTTMNSSSSSSGTQSSGSSLETRERRDICAMVRKQWKLAHVECSAKTNWRIINIFKELTRLCDILENSHAKENIHHAENFHPLHPREKCNIF